LGCGIQTGAGAVLNTFKAHAGSSIVIFGAGGVGLSAVMAAQVAGCTTIIAVDINSDRLDLAKELGATHTVSATDPELKDKLKTLTGGDGSDFALDTTGRPEVLRNAFEGLKQKGVAGLIGGSAPGNLSFTV
jgi:aryl-alcohol dehydrogenase